MLFKNEDGRPRHRSILLPKKFGALRVTDSSIKWKIEELPDLKGFTIESVDEGNFILSKRNKLYRTRDLQTRPKQIATISAPTWKTNISRIRLAQRLLRFMVTNVVVLSNGDLFVTFD